jgi:hypothetical protein
LPALRRSELAQLQVGDIEEVPEGLRLRLRRSKSDQEAAGRKVEVVYGTDRAICPVRAYRAWTAMAEPRDGPLLRRVDRHGWLLGPLSAQGVAIVVKRHMGRLGDATSDLAEHSPAMGGEGP